MSARVSILDGLHGNAYLQCISVSIPPQWPLQSIRCGIIYVVMWEQVMYTFCGLSGDKFVFLYRDGCWGNILEFVLRSYMRGIAMLCDDIFHVMMCVS